MIRKIKIIVLLFLPILLLSCGFKSVHQKGKKNIYLQNINIIGEKKIAYTLKNNISLISNKNSENKYDIQVKIDKRKKTKIKNLSGKTTRYSLSLSANMTLKDINENTEVKKIFTQNTNYEVSTIHSDTINNEKNATKSILQQLSNDMINFIVITTRY